MGNDRKNKDKVCRFVGFIFAQILEEALHAVAC